MPPQCPRARKLRPKLQEQIKFFRQQKNCLEALAWPSSNQYMAITVSKTEIALIGKHNRSPLSPPMSSTPDIRSRLPRGQGESVYNQTIRNRLRVQLRARVPETEVLLTSQYRTRGLAWCHCCRTWNIEGHLVFFMDESHFCLWRKDAD
ncbi:hypothetical protein TNCV_647351 [Trichonephila clavipes]|uniref:Uncharacterized protein n=1 Tax=Trichonephila clavipes TaxID=2585209 RepID=A0A8X6SUJ6_TRICX|nr:hypothetical protein TNCV_647351 [Trichonephila clavipes]